MKDRPEGTIGGLWRKSSGLASVYRMDSTGQWKFVTELNKGDPNYEKLIIVLALVGPAPGFSKNTHAFYFTPEEYRSIMEGGHDST